jgi:hypothetical protein
MLAQNKAFIRQIPAPTAAAKATYFSWGMSRTPLSPLLLLPAPSEGSWSSFFAAGSASGSLWDLATDLFDLNQAFDGP